MSIAPCDQLAPAASGNAHLPEGGGEGPDRLEWLGQLFRRSMARGDVHPLLQVVRQYHGVSGVFHRAPSPADAAAAGAPAPRAPIVLTSLQQAVTRLPSLPRAVQQALAASQDERAGAVAVAECIEHDQALAARILRAANTAFYGATGRVDTIRSAIAVLGLRTVSALLTAAAVADRLPVPADGRAFEFRRIWRHSLTTGIVARGLAPALRLDPEVAFTSALLHDIGMLALMHAFPAQYEQALRYGQASDRPLWEAERAVTGVDHGAAGELLARHWHLPPTIIDTIARHHLPTDRRATTGAPTMVELVHLADALTHGIGSEGDTDHEAVPDVSVELWTLLGLDPATCLTVMRSGAEAAQALCEALTS